MLQIAFIIIQEVEIFVSHHIVIRQEVPVLTALLKQHYYRSLQRGVKARKVASLHIEAYIAQVLVALKRIASDQPYHYPYRLHTGTIFSFT